MNNQTGSNAEFSCVALINTMIFGCIFCRAVSQQSESVAGREVPDDVRGSAGILGHGDAAGESHRSAVLGD